MLKYAYIASNAYILEEVVYIWGTAYLWFVDGKIGFRLLV